MKTGGQYYIRHKQWRAYSILRNENDTVRPHTYNMRTIRKGRIRDKIFEYDLEMGARGLPE